MAKGKTLDKRGRGLTKYVGHWMIRLFWDKGNEDWRLVAARRDPHGGASDVWDFGFPEEDKSDAQAWFGFILDYEELEDLTRRTHEAAFERYDSPPRPLPEGF